MSFILLDRDTIYYAFANCYRSCVVSLVLFVVYCSVPCDHRPSVLYLGKKTNEKTTPHLRYSYIHMERQLQKKHHSCCVKAAWATCDSELRCCCRCCHEKTQHRPKFISP